MIHRKNFDNKWINILFSVLFNGVIIVSLIYFFHVNFDIPDDALFARNILDGFDNVLYFNYFLSKFIGIIQDLIYPLNAYTIIDLAFAYLSFCTITYVFLNKFGYKKALIIMLFIEGFFAVNYYNTISFTRLPAVLATAGFIAIIHFSRCKKGLIGIVWGVFLVILSSMYRFNVFILVFAIAVFLVLAISLEDFFDLDKEKKTFVNLLKIIFEPKRFTCAILIIVTSFSFNILSKNIEKSTEEMQYYSKYTSARSAVWDYPIPDYNEKAKEYDKINIDENDIAMLRQACFDDEGAFTLENLYAIEDIKEDSHSDITMTLHKIAVKVIAELYEVFHLTIEGLSIIAFMVVFLLYFFFNKKNKFLTPFLIAFMVAVCYLYMFWINRIVFRVNSGVLFAATTFLLYTYDFSFVHSSLKKRAVKYTSLICVIIVSFVGLFLTQQKNVYEKDYPLNSKETAFVEYMENHKENKYELVGVKSFYIGLIDHVSSPFYIEKTDYENNAFVAAGMFYRSPAYNYQLKMFGTDNFYSNLLNDNVYLVVDTDNDISEVVRKYLQKYYANGDNVGLKYIDKNNGYLIYKCTKE